MSLALRDLEVPPHPVGAGATIVVFRPQDNRAGFGAGGGGGAVITASSAAQTGPVTVVPTVIPWARSKACNLARV